MVSAPICRRRLEKPLGEWLIAQPAKVPLRLIFTLSVACHVLKKGMAGRSIHLLAWLSASNNVVDVGMAARSIPVRVPVAVSWVAGRWVAGRSTLTKEIPVCWLQCGRRRDGWSLKPPAGAAASELALSKETRPMKKALRRRRRTGPRQKRQPNVIRWLIAQPLRSVTGPNKGSGVAGRSTPLEEEQL